MSPAPPPLTEQCEILGAILDPHALLSVSDQIGRAAP
jgi:hypothetical protein